MRQICVSHALFHMIIPELEFHLAWHEQILLLYVLRIFAYIHVSIVASLKILGKHRTVRSFWG